MKRAPYQKGDTVIFADNGAGDNLPKGTRCQVLAIGSYFDELVFPAKGKQAWSVKIAVNGKSLGWWSAAWFKKSR